MWTVFATIITEDDKCLPIRCEYFTKGLTLTAYKYFKENPNCIRTTVRLGNPEESRHLCHQLRKTDGIPEDGTIWLCLQGLDLQEIKNLTANTPQK